MNCLHCHTEFEATASERRACPVTEVPYCSWECFKDDERGLRWHANALPKKERERFLNGKGLTNEAQAKERCRAYYHVGTTAPKAGSREAARAEEQYKARMRESCAQKPPRLAGASLCSAEDMGSPTLLPSEIFFGKANRRVCDETALHLGGEDGEKFNFEGE